MKITDFLKQTQQQLITTKSMVLTIDLSNYDNTNFLEKEEGKKIWVKSLLAKAIKSLSDNLLKSVILQAPVYAFQP